MTITTWLRVTASTFAVSYFAAMFTATLPEGAYDDGRVVGLLSGTELTGIVLGGYSLMIAGVAALAFTSLLATTLAHGSAGQVSPPIVRSLGTGYGVILLVAAVLFLAVPMGHVVGELPEATPSPFRELTMAGFAALLLAALLCAAVLVVVVSVVVRRDALAPSWVAVTGFVIAPLLLLGVGWAPQFLVPLWAVLVGFTVRPAPVSRAAAAMTPTATR